LSDRLPLNRLGQAVGKEGKTRERTRFQHSRGSWGMMEASVNSLVEVFCGSLRMLDRLHRSDEALVGRKVLIVDDDVRNIFALSSVLERRGMTVLTAGTGREAIATVESTNDLAIVLMDVMMPEMDGTKRCRSFDRTLNSGACRSSR
jgi:hypothetical protein